MDILSAGLLVSDIIVSPIDASVFRADTVPIQAPKFIPGGDALNAAIHLAELGVRTGICGMAGQDSSGAFLIREAEKAGLESHIRLSEESGTATSIVLCEPNGERHFAYYGESNDRFAPEMIPDSLLQETKILYIGSVMGLKNFRGTALRDLFRRAKQYGARTAMDATYAPDGITLAKIEEALPYTDLFFPSFCEASELTGKQDVREMRDVMALCGLGVFGVKLGKAGCYVTDFQSEYEVSAFACDPVVDTTGAGDAFMAGYLYGFLRGWGIRDSAVFGGAVSNFCIRAYGATTNAPDLTQVTAFLEEQGIVLSAD